MTFQQLTYLIEISKWGSINKAAKSLYISQSGISTSISELEKELGIVFFERNNRGVIFTPEGREFLGYAKSLLDQKKWIESLYQGDEADTDETVSLVVASQRFPFAESAFLEYLEQHNTSRYRYVFKEETMDALINDVHDHHADIGLLFLSRASCQIVRHMLLSKKMELHKLGSTRPAVYLRAGHPLAGKSEVGVEDLAPFPYVAFDHRQGVASDFLEEYQTPGMKRGFRHIIVSERSMCYQVMLRTDCYTTGSGLLSDEIDLGDIISIPMKGEPLLDICWISSSLNGLPRSAWDFLGILKQKLSRSMEFTQKVRDDLAADTPEDDI